MSYAYQPAHEAHLTKHNNQMFEFDSPATIAKQQLQQQQFQQAGGAPSIGSAPAPPPLPQLGFKNSRPLGLRTRDWNNKPWNGQSNAYVPPPSLLKNNSASSLNKFPVYMPSSNWGNRSIASTTSSPRTPSLLGVYDPDLLAGQTTHLQSSSDHHPQASGYQSGAQPALQSGIQPALQSAMQSGLQSGHSGLPATNYSPSSTIPLSHNFHLPSSQLSQSAIPTQSAMPNGSNLSLNKGSSIPLDSNLSLNKGSSIPLDSNLSLNKGSSIPLDSNLSLNKGSSIPSGNLSLNKESSILGGNNLPLGQSSSIPNAPAWTGYRHGAWRANRNKPNLRLRTKNWGSRSKKGWSGYNSRSILDEGFLRNRPQAIPMAPPMASLFGQRKWKSGPYRMRPLRTRNWGPRNEDGWSHFNRGIFMHESALPFMANRQKWADTADLSRDIPQQSNLSAPIQQSNLPIQQSNLSAPIQQSNFSAPIQQSNFSAPIQQSFSSAPISAAPIAAPLAAAPLVAPVAPLTGRKGKRAARKLRKQQAIQAKLTTELTPPVGDPAVNHYRRGAKATVPLAGPAVGLANPTGSVASRRTGRRNNLGRRRNRLAAPALPVPATQPPVVGLAPVAPLSTSLPLSNSVPLSAPLSATSASFVPINSAPLSSSYGSSRQTIAPSFARSAGIPLNTQQSSSLYSSAAQQSRPLSSTFAQPITASNKPLYSAHEPVAAQIMEKQQPIIQNRPIGSATF